LFWGLLGLGLLAVEMMTLTFFFAFFGVSALIVAGLRLAGVENTAANLILFSLIGSIGLLLFRKRLRLAFSKTEAKFDVDHNAIIALTESLPARGEGRVQYQGTTWGVVNEEDTELPAGTRVRIAKVQGIKLHVKRHD
jgi:membrane protein implicated in regulation of membrane protease activity